MRIHPRVALTLAAAILSKLDAIERRLANIEAMEAARGPKPPFSFTVPSAGAPVVASQFAPNCRSLGYRNVAIVSPPLAFPSAPGAVTVICHE
jgi:hypothetical protein